MRGESRKTPLHYATSNKNPKVIETLIEGGADINAVDEDGATALHYGASAAVTADGKPEIIAALLKAGADPNAKAKGGQTPLHFARTGDGNPEIIATLIEAGANLYLVPSTYAVVKRPWWHPSSW